MYGTAEPASLPRAAKTVESSAPGDMVITPAGDRQLTTTLPGTSMLLIGWATLSLILGGRFLFSVGRLSGRRAEWQRATVGGTSLLVSADSGPAVVGFVRPEIVVPEWATSLSDDELAMLLEHERQHVQAGDQWLALFAELMCVAMPWNAGLWFQRRRLRRAIELDCDRRVLARRVSPVRYGRLLLDVGERITAWRAPVAVAFAERRSELGERIEALVHRGRRSGPRGIAASVLGAVVVAIVACEAPHPSPVGPTGAESVAKRDPAPTVQPEARPEAGPTSVDLLRAEAIRRLQAKTGSHAPVEQVVAILDAEGRLVDVSSSGEEVDRHDIARIEIVKSKGHPGLIMITLKPAAGERGAVERRMRESLTREALGAGVEPRTITTRLVPLRARTEPGLAPVDRAPDSLRAELELRATLAKRDSAQTPAGRLRKIH